MSSDSIAQTLNITSPDGSEIPMAKFNKETCIQLLSSMIDSNAPHMLYYVRASEPAGTGKTKHAYRFYVINRASIFNVSGAVTAAFGAEVNDRSQTFTINSMAPADDLRTFSDALKKLLLMPDLELVDLLENAKQVLEFNIASDALAFFPPVDLPQSIRDSATNSQGPVELPS